MGLENGHSGASSRRAFLGRAAGAGAGIIAVAAAGAVGGISPATAAPTGAQGNQSDWRFCQKCYSMFFWGYPTDGVCPSGGAHSAQGFNFVLPHDIPETPTRQRNWRFCQKCYSMFFWGYPTDGVCAAGGAHSAQGFNFALPHT